MDKVLIIGLDGATLDIIKPFAEDGKLPTFKKLMEDDAYGILENTSSHRSCMEKLEYLTF
ncbi:MAG: hypothetical protein ACE5KT_05555 [Methanosarcinales archaeon]